MALWTDLCSYDGQSWRDDEGNAFSLAFAPDGVLFVGDTLSGSIVAIQTGDTGGGDPAAPDVRERISRMSFEPSDRPGIFGAVDSGDLLSAEAFAWAW